MNLTTARSLETAWLFSETLNSYPNRALFHAAFFHDLFALSAARRRCSDDELCRYATELDKVRSRGKPVNLVICN